MTKRELFKRYGVSEGHNTWDPMVDSWFSVEIYRQTHEGQLPPPDDMSIGWVLTFLDKTEDPAYFFSLDNPGIHYTTAKRMVYRHADAILAEIATINREVEQ